MLDFSQISNKTIVGTTLRLPLKLIPKNTILPIFQGILKGLKWIKGSGVNTYWIGTYEKDQQILFASKIREGDVVFDIGANVGFYSLIASKLTGSTGKVYAFEPAPKNLNYLKRHIEINKCINSTVVSGAVSNKKDLMYFDDGDHAATGSLSKKHGALLVPTFDLDSLIDDEIITPPNLMKVDVEGAEFDVLTGGQRMLEKYHPTVFLATHNTGVHKECLNLLRSLNYKLESISELNLDDTDAVLATYQ